MKYFIYCRKSSDREDKQVLSTDAQQRILKAFAEKHQLAIVDTFVEKQSAYKTGRPFFNQMMARLEAGEADAILVYHLTRLARNSYDGGRIIYLMDEEVVAQIRTPDSVFVNKSDDKFMMQIHFAMAKKSSDDTSQFVSRDIESKLLKGEYPGVVPLGYLNVDRAGRIAPTQYDPEKQRLLESLGRPLEREEIDPLDGELVKRLFEEAGRGTHTLRSLHALAFKVGLRTRKGMKIPKSTIYNLLTNPYFCGFIRHGGKLYTENIQHAPLISRQLFDRVQLLICRRGKGGMRKHLFAYTGIIHCGECTCAVTAEIQRGHVYYHCTHNKGSCGQRSWSREEELDDLLGGVLSQLHIPESFLRFAFDRVKVLHKHQAKSQDAIRHKLERQYAELKHRQDALLTMKLSSKNVDGALLSDDEYLKQKQEIRKEVELVEGQLTATRQNEATWIEDCENFVGFTQRLKETFLQGSFERKKELLSTVCSNIILKDQQIAVEYREPFNLLAAFPLAGSQPLEREKSLTEGKMSGLMERWLPRLDSNQ